MNRSAFPGVLAAVMIALTGCSSGSDESAGSAVDDIGTLWGEDSSAEKARKAELARLREIKVPIQAVREIEIGRTRDGFIITAFGTAPGLGFSLPQLRPRRSGAPGADGFVEFDFVASEPAPGLDLPPGTLTARALRADRPVTLDELRGAAGIRVLAINGGVQLTF